MSRHHEMANDFYSDCTIILDCSLCYNMFKRDVSYGGTGDERLRASKAAHKEGWRFYRDKTTEYDGQQLTITGPVCPECNDKIS